MTTTTESVLPSAVREYYQEKTARLLDKYGPGPRVHYHIGYFPDAGMVRAESPEAVRSVIRDAQVELVRRAAAVWDAAATLSGRILDIGCGLGGGALHWAEHHGATVTAVTIAGEHAPVIERHAAEAGVSDRIRVLVGDAAELSFGPGHDGAVAMESMCYMDRAAVFRRVAAALRPGASFCVQDVFLRDPAWKKTFDRYWATDIGTAEEYRRNAGAAGLTMDRNERVTERTSDFWVHSIAWIEAKLAATAPNTTEQARLLESLRRHALFYRAWREGAFDIRFLRFTKY
ncbi:class I SAM-dependent methyltransferase [Streptomyces sp. NPDC005805]|uniref:SAM-dependent methyltransferase n=1 Tax=Streptomyces sp. NPDC005805 TaxID=3157068 RepID=UPI0033E4656B